LKAAEKGSALGQYGAGLCYQMGLGVVVNYGEAAKCFQMASMQGNVDAKQALAVCFVVGRGVDKDLSQAVELFSSVAAGSDSLALSSQGQMSLGICYYHGDGVPQDRDQASSYFQQSAQKGNASAHMWLARLASERTEPSQALEHVQAAMQCCQQHPACIGDLRHGDAVVENFTLPFNGEAEHWALYDEERHVFYERGVKSKSLTKSAGHIVRTPEASFMHRNCNDFKRVVWSDVTEESISRGGAVELARSRVGEKGYHILERNCEHFVMECVFPCCDLLRTSIRATRFKNDSSWWRRAVASTL